MAYHVRLLIPITLLCMMGQSLAGKCNRRIEGVATQPVSVEGRFSINLWALNQTENVEQYMPNTRYIVTINGHNISNIQEKFTRFLLSTDNQDESSNIEGKFDIIDESLTKYHDDCPNVVIETTKISKEQVAIAWTSPEEGSGCIIMRATVMETPETWYMDEAGISKVFCQDPKADADDPGPVLSECCACDEAKYEVTFEGVWSRNTHPKNYPPKNWLTRFSDVIGASHTFGYRFWRYNETASEGLQQVAEFGSTRKLESELKDQSENIRTIIKARGITHPNVTSKTFAVFRVDRKHHLMSLVSMIVPSPDWIVGVSGLELCLSNCSWIEHKELNLYPIDAGTDDGITYMSPDSPTDSPQPIRLITTTWPNDSQSPFFDPIGADMKPMAKLHLNRQRLYEKNCNDSNSSPVNTGGDEISNEPEVEKPNKKGSKIIKACRTTPWAAWGPCGVSCGRGKKLRQRNYKNKAAAKLNSCNEKLSDRADCVGSGPDCDGQSNEGTILNSPECDLTEWSSWSSCSTTCGDGSITRSRMFKHKRHRKKCRAVSNGPELEQTDECKNTPCENEEMREETEIDEAGDEDEDESENEAEGEDDNPAVTEEWLQKCPKHEYNPWSQWSPCSVTCGSGMKSRFRLPTGEVPLQRPTECKEQHVNCVAEVPDCNITPAMAEEMCTERLMPGNCQRIYKRVYFDSEKQRCQFFDYSGCDGNKNNFDTMEACKTVCLDIRKGQSSTSNVKKNFQVSLSSVLSYHIPAQGEKRSGKSKRARFEQKDSDDFNGIQTGSQVMSTTREYEGDGKVDCQATEWSDWLPCKTCKGRTYKTRGILVKAKNGGERCPKKLIRKRKCQKRPECAGQNHSRRRRYRNRNSVWNPNKSIP